MLLLPSTIDTKAAGFGFGDKLGVLMRDGRDSPPPNSYKIKGQFDKLRPNQGRSFGIPHSAYAKVYNPNNKVTSVIQDAPGPGAYEVKGMVGVNAKKFSLKSRVPECDSNTRSNPPPNSYHPNYTLSENSKFGAITFGFGSRCNVTGCKSNTLC